MSPRLGWARVECPRAASQVSSSAIQASRQPSGCVLSGQPTGLGCSFWARSLLPGVLSGQPTKGQLGRLQASQRPVSLWAAKWTQGGNSSSQPSSQLLRAGTAKDSQGTQGPTCWHPSMHPSLQPSGHKWLQCLSGQPLATSGRLVHARAAKQSA